MLRNSKKFTLLITLFFSISIVSFAVYEVRPKTSRGVTTTTTKLNISKEIATSTSEDILDIDTDKDGLNDWEEKLWETDPLNPDTDNDGTKDGEEITANRDPKKAGPNDELKNNSSPTSQKNTDIPPDAFTQAFIADYLALKKGQPISEDEKKRLADILLKQVATNSAVLEARTYSIQDIVVSDDNSATAFKKYAVLLRATASKQEKHDLEAAIVTRAIQNKNSEELLKLDPIIRRLEEIIVDLMALPAPTKLATAHLEVMNTLSAIITADKEMQLIMTDPFAGAKGTQEYYVAVQRLFTAFDDVKKILLTQNITL